jgi:hypothetical protein
MSLEELLPLHLIQFLHAGLPHHGSWVLLALRALRGLELLSGRGLGCHLLMRTMACKAG